MLTTLTDSVLSVIFPSSCAACGAGVESHADGSACADCWAGTRILSDANALCEKCGSPLFDRRSGGSRTCGECREQHYDKAFSVGVYEMALAAAVVSLKKDPRVPARLAGEIAAAFGRRPELSVTRVVAVPLSKKRHNERGFNQAAVIGKIVGGILGLGTDGSSVERSSHTQMHRGSMDRKAREASVQKAFKVIRPKLIAGENILLVDDVFTTGSTVSACARVLKDAGAEGVTVFTLARATMRF